MNRVMDNMTPAAVKKYIVPLVIFLAVSMGVWYVGAHLAVNGYLPLRQADRRFIVISCLFILFLYRILYGAEDSQQTRSVLADTPFMQKNLQLLENRVQGAVNFLRRTRIAKNGQQLALNHLPWYLLVGAPGSGKTTMLANSKIRFILDKQFKDENIRAIPHSETCDWWVTRDMVLVDVPGAYVTANSKRQSLTNRLWLSFLELIKRIRGNYGLSGVVLTFSVADMMDRQRRDAYLSDLRGSIAALKDKFGHELPFYMAITKSDLLPGFMDFFGECSVEELAQAWGVPLPAMSAGDMLPEIFAKRFDALIHRLNQQLLLRLHQERNSYSRIYIKDFPLQLERLKECLVEVLKVLTLKESFNLQGVYLTSGVQGAAGNNKMDPPQMVPGDEYQRSLQIMHQPAMPPQSCFVKQFILHVLAPAQRMNYSTKIKTNIKRIIYDK